jgi:DNA-binding NarL/FixJ family response regulator
MDYEHKTGHAELGDVSVSQTEPTRPKGTIPSSTEMPLTDVEVHAAVKRFLDHSELPLADVKVHAAVNEGSLDKTSTSGRVWSGNSVVVLTANENLGRLFEALEKNAAEAHLEDISRRDLDAAAQQALRGESPLDPDIAARLLLLLADRDRDQMEMPAEPLTPRQLDILKFLAKGKTNVEIARELVLSTGTVRTHVQRILSKLNVSGRTGAVVRAIELGLISPEAGS